MHKQGEIMQGAKVFFKLDTKKMEIRVQSADLGIKPKKYNISNGDEITIILDQVLLVTPPKVLWEL